MPTPKRIAVYTVAPCVFFAIGLMGTKMLIQGGYWSPPSISMFENFESSSKPSTATTTIDSILVVQPSTDQKIRISGYLESSQSDIKKIESAMPQIKASITLYLLSIELNQLSSPSSISRLSEQISRRIALAAEWEEPISFYVSELILR